MLRDLWHTAWLVSGEEWLVIGNRKNGLDGRYWLYLVNGKLATDAADRRRTQAGDRIEWCFEKHEPSPR